MTGDLGGTTAPRYNFSMTLDEVDSQNAQLRRQLTALQEAAAPLARWAAAYEGRDESLVVAGGPWGFFRVKDLRALKEASRER